MFLFVSILFYSLLYPSYRSSLSSALSAPGTFPSARLVHVSCRRLFHSPPAFSSPPTCRRLRSIRHPGCSGAISFRSFLQSHGFWPFLQCSADNYAGANIVSAMCRLNLRKPGDGGQSDHCGITSPPGKPFCQLLRGCLGSLACCACYDVIFLTAAYRPVPGIPPVHRQVLPGRSSG